MDEEDCDELYDEATQEEREEVDEKVVDHATAAALDSGWKLLFGELKLWSERA